MKTAIKSIIALLALATVSYSEMMPIPEFESLIDGKKIKSRPSPEFLENESKWQPGEKFPTDFGKLSERAAATLSKMFPGQWLAIDASINSFKLKSGVWYMTFIFQGNKNNYAVVIVNMKGEVWPVGKIYDEFDK